MLSFFPRDVLDEIWDLTESVSEGFPTYLKHIFVRLYMKFGYNWPNGFWGDVLDCHTMRVLGQRSNNDLDFLHS